MWHPRPLKWRARHGHEPEDLERRLETSWPALGITRQTNSEESKLHRSFRVLDLRSNDHFQIKII